MKRGLQGRKQIHKVPGEPFAAFIPRALPPDPPLVMDAGLIDVLERANRAIGRLDGLSVLFPDISLFIYFYVRKEAVLSSQIEGTQSSLSDLLLYESKEAPGVPLEDVATVANYVAAIEYGMKQLNDGAPLTLRLLRELHRELLTNTRGEDKQPGEFRRSQNWIGGTRPGNATFVPPPAPDVMDCLDRWEKFMHDMPTRTPALIKAALLHLQFETIHPFLDGNGRVGRLLIPLLLCAEGALSKPLLYLSLYLKTHRDTYYALLQRVRLEGDWEEWVRFFLTGVADTAEEATRKARTVFRLFESERVEIGRMGRTAGSTLRLHTWMQAKPAFRIAEAAAGLQMSTQTTISAVNRLKKLGIVIEVTGRQRNRMYVYGSLVAAMGDEVDLTVDAGPAG